MKVGQPIDRHRDRIDRAAIDRAINDVNARPLPAGRQLQIDAAQIDALDLQRRVPAELPTARGTPRGRRPA